MFTVGQMAFHKSGSHAGRVVDVDGDTIYLVQTNGVEIDFPSRELTASAPQEDVSAGAVAYARSESTGAPVRLTERRGSAAPVVLRPRQLTASDITDEHRKVLSVIPKRTLEAVATLHDRQPNAGRFAALDIARKLNFIAEVTEVSYRAMKDNANQPGTLGLMMGRGLSVRLRPSG